MHPDTDYMPHPTVCMPTQNIYIQKLRFANIQKNSLIFEVRSYGQISISLM